MMSAPLRLARRLRHAVRARSSRARGPAYLVSACGQPNFGDEFITRAWLDWLAEHQPEREVWLDTIEPGRAAHLFRDTHPRLKTTNTLWHLAHTGPADIDEAVERVQRLLREFGSPRFDLGLRELRRMESIHLLGGGYINSLWPENLGVIAAMTTLRTEFGVRIFATGQGLMPAEGEVRDWLMPRLREFDFVESRDAESAEAFGITQGVDDAFLAFANGRPVYAAEDSIPDSMILVQGDMFDSAHDPELAALVRGFVARADDASSVGFAEAIPPDDLKFAAEHVDDRSPFFPFIRMWDEGFPAKPGQEWLTSRFHFHLLAAAAGAKGAFLNAKPGYYDVKHGSLTALGTGWTAQGFAPEAGGAEPSADARFPAVARRLGRHKSRLASRLYRAPR